MKECFVLQKHHFVNLFNSGTKFVSQFIYFSLGKISFDKFPFCKKLTFPNSDQQVFPGNDLQLSFHALLSCNTLRRCNSLQYVAILCNTCNTLQYFAIHCNILQYIAHNTLQYFPLHCDDAKHGNSLQYIKILCNMLQYIALLQSAIRCDDAIHCNTLQYFTLHCNDADLSWKAFLDLEPGPLPEIEKYPCLLLMGNSTQRLPKV